MLGGLQFCYRVGAARTTVTLSANAWHVGVCRATLSKYVGVWSRLRSAGMRAWDARLSLQGNPVRVKHLFESETRLTWSL